MKKEKGITLIALVITIIVLLILAGVTISLILGGNGLLNKATKAGEEYTKAAIKEEIELAIADIGTELASKIPPESLSNQAVMDNLPNKTQETITIDDALTGSYKGYEYWIDENYEVRIGDRLDQVVMSVNLEVKRGTSDLTAIVTAKSTKAEIATYTYIIDGISTEELTTNTYTVENLEPEATHKIQVLVKDEKGNEKYSKEVQVTTEARTYLYKAGDECIDLTGGWERTSYNCGSFTKEDTYMNLYSSNSPGTFINGCSTANQIDLTKYKKVCFNVEFDTEYSMNGGYYYWNAVVVSQNKAYQYNTWTNDCYARYGQSNNISEKNKNLVIPLDVKEVTSSYIGVRYARSSGSLGFNINFKIYNVWLEK